MQKKMQKKEQGSAQSVPSASKEKALFIIAIACAIVFAGSMQTACFIKKGWPEMEHLKTDKMTAYMNKKYKEKFTFAGSFGGQLGKDYSMIYVESEERPGMFALVRCEETKSGEIFTDNYAAILKKAEIEALLRPAAEEIYGECKLFFKVPELVLPENYQADITAEEFLEREESLAQIYLFPKEKREASREEKEAGLTSFCEISRQKGYLFRGVVSYPKSPEDYEMIRESNFVTCGYEGYQAFEEIIFSMEKHGGFRYMKWL